MTTQDAWSPAQYERFRSERARPFEDLLALVDRETLGTGTARVVDLGCGTGELTARLHEHLEAAETLGIDSSPAMLERACPLEGVGLRFAPGEIESWRADGEYDVVFSNAALHWVPDHARLLPRLRRALRPGGQLAVQVPANGDHPSHALAFELAHEPPFRDALLDTGEPLAESTPVLAPERYAELLDDLGFGEQHVRLQVYPHRLASSAEVVEWTKGTTLTRFERRLPPEMYAELVDRYRSRLLDAVGDRSPYLYTFKRVLFWGRLAP